MIPRPAITLIKTLLIEYHDNICQPNFRRTMASLLKRYWWKKMTIECKFNIQHCTVCNRAKPDRSREGEMLCIPWEFLNTHGKFLDLITS
jgi:hypothetical protein